MNKRLLILGNGFDLDLGLNTRYSDFFKSKHFQDLRFQYSSLWQELRASVASNLWLDLEAELFQYAAIPSGLYSHKTATQIEYDRAFFDALKNALTAYILEESNKYSKTDCSAYRLIRLAMKAGFYIYNFNYTNPLRMLTENVEVYSKRLCYVHGCAENNTIILGCPDTAKLKDNHEYLVKSYSPHFRSNNLSSDLEEANDIIFFGLSMGEVDNIYFEDLFKNGTNEKRSSSKKRRVRIVTFDESSRIAILNNIKRMNGIRADKLFQKWDFDFIKTCEGRKSDQLDELLTHLQRIIDGDNRVAEYFL